MILGNPVARLVIRAMSAFGVIPGQRDPGAGRADRDRQKDSPFVLVARAADGSWGVFERNFDIPLAVFDELQDACNHANELARSRIDSLVLIRKGRDLAADPDSYMAGRKT